MIPQGSRSAVRQATGSQVWRAPGKLRNLEEILHEHPPEGTFGIGHTRWATHGRPTEENAHPHRDCDGRIVVVHNGIVENYLDLKRELTAQGHKFVTETDTEIIAHLIEQIQKDAQAAGAPLNLEQAVRVAVKRLTGAFALGVLSASEPDKIVAARSGPPVVIGVGEGESFVASDIPGILHHTRNVVLSCRRRHGHPDARGVKLTDFDGKPIDRRLRIFSGTRSRRKRAATSTSCSRKSGSSRGRFETRRWAGSRSTQARSSWARWRFPTKSWRSASSINIAACGTSWHAALAGKYMIERLARLPVDVDYASEYRYRNPIPDRNALGLLITQSGETADTLAAQREMIALGSKTVAICNVVGAMVAREAHGAIYTHAGPEIGVASTKAFTAQLTALFILALKLGQLRGRLDTARSVALMEELSRIPAKIEEVLRSLFRAVRKARQGLQQCARLSLSRPRDSLPDRARRRAEAQGDLVHPRRRLSGRRNEARAKRPDRRDAAGGGAGDAR